MQFGFCGEFSWTTPARAAGYDFAEWTVSNLLGPRQSDAEFAPNLAAIRAAALPYPAANGFIPADLKITGPHVDRGALEAYATRAFARAQTAGVDVIVFGSGGARAIPEGYSRDAAWEQLVAFTKMIAPVAAAHAVTVVVEPLNRTGGRNNHGHITCRRRGPSSSQ